VPPVLLSTENPVASTALLIHVKVSWAAMASVGPRPNRPGQGRPTRAPAPCSTWPWLPTHRAAGCGGDPSGCSAEGVQRSEGPLLCHPRGEAGRQPAGSGSSLTRTQEGRL